MPGVERTLHHDNAGNHNHSGNVECRGVCSSVRSARWADQREWEFLHHAGYIFDCWDLSFSDCGWRGTVVSVVVIGDGEEIIYACFVGAFLKDGSQVEAFPRARAEAADGSM